MEIPSILQGHSRTRLLQVITIGAVATLVIGFSWGEWVTGTKAPSAAETSGKIQSEAYRQAEEVRNAADAKSNNR